jgi:hypothetical protein
MTAGHTRMLGPRRKSPPAALIMRRPLLVRRAGSLLRLGRIQAIRYRADLRLERLNFAVLAKNHVAELGVGAFQEGYLGLYFDQSLAIHGGSLASRR